MSQTHPDIFLRKLLLGRYVPDKLVSATSEWITYAATDRETQQSVHVQRLAGTLAKGIGREKLQSVADALGRLRQIPRVIAPLAAGVHAGIPFLVCPRKAGETLADRLRIARDMGVSQGSRRSLRVWLDAIAETLDIAHQNEVYHGRLSPQAIVFLEGGEPALNSLALASVISALSAPGRENANAGRLPVQSAPYAAPEVKEGQPPAAASDQYSLAAIVAEASGVHARDGAPDIGAASLAKAMAADSRARYSNCVEFVQAFFEELDNPASRQQQSRGGQSIVGDLIDPGPSEHAGGQASQGLPAREAPLELATAPQRKSHATGEKRLESSEVDELADITFTRPGEKLLTPKSMSSQVASVGAANASWRKALSEFRNLPDSKRWIARLVTGVVALALVYVVLAVVYRATVAATSWIRSGVQTTIAKVAPSSDAIREEMSKLPGQVRSIWEQVTPDTEKADSETVANVQPAVVTSTRSAGEAWPERDEDRFGFEKLAAPLELQKELLAAKDEPPRQLAEGGLAGTFFVEDESAPSGVGWVGDFYAPPKSATRLGRPILEGNVMRESADGTVLIAKFTRGEMEAFWLTAGPNDARVTVYSKLDNVSDTAILSGAAFVLDGGATECLALSFDHGEVVGGQWCRKLPPPEDDPEATLMFEPPEDIVPAGKLEANDKAFVGAVKLLQEAAAKVPDFQKEAKARLQAAWSKATR